MKSSLALALALTGCVATAQPSRSALGPAESQAAIRAPPREAAQAIVQLFASRGFALVDQQTREAALLLRFKGNRETESCGELHSHQFGSAFYVSIDPGVDDQAVVSIDSTPVADGIELCAPYTLAPCRSGLVESLEHHVDGRAEADVVRGVFSELALHDLVAGPGPRKPAVVQQLTPQQLCAVARHRALREAYQADDDQERKRLIAAAPTCH
jgi:hypothetical protein